MTLAPLLFAFLSAVPQDGPAGLAEREAAAFKAAAAAAAPSAVRIETLGGVDTAGGRLLGQGPSTGTVVRADGLILTSSENFVGDPTSILVRLPDGRRLAAERLGEDEARQLTLIRVDADGLTAAVPAPVDDLRVGDWAVAVGRTFSADGVNLSVGVVSAKDRILGRAVQTDAKTSPANYGGPLVDLAGRTIGVLAPLSPGGGQGGVEWYDSGIGFAVPLEDVLPVLDRLAAGQTLRPGKLGVTFKGAALDAEPVVDSVRPQSPADAAGLRSGDRLIAVAGRPVGRPDAVKLALGPLYAGDEAALVVERDGERVELTATLAAELPPWNPGDLGVLPGDRPAEGAENDGGVPIAHVFPDSAADGALVAGDVIVAAGGEAVATAEDLRRIVSRRTPGTAVTLTLADGEERDMTLGERPGEPPAVLPAFESDADPLPAESTGRLDLEVAGFDGRGGALLVPESPGRGGFALLVVLPVKGELLLDTIFDRLGPAAGEQGVILMVPRPELPIGVTQRDLPFFAAALEQTTERYAVDPARVAVMGIGEEGRSAWGVAQNGKGTYRGVASEEAPPRVGENEPDSPLFPLLLAPPDVDAVDRLNAGGLPFAVLPGEVPAGEVPAGEAAAAVIRWAAALDRI